MGRVEEWAQFTRAWNRRLLAEPKISFLKTHNAAKFQGEFSRFYRQPAKRDEKVRWLASTVNDFDFEIVQASLEVEPFQELHPVAMPIPGQTPNTRRVLSDLTESPYVFCAFLAIYRVCYVLHERGETVNRPGKSGGSKP